MAGFINRFFNRIPKSVTQAPARDVGIGSVLAQRYRLDAGIGRGGMGIVYRARDLEKNRDVALKLISLETADARTRAQFLHEAKIASQLHHPHIVEVLGSGGADTGGPEPSPYIVMEFIRGTSLDQLRHLPIARVIDLARQICEALEYAHGQGLVHRDLKPQNVLLEKHGFRTVAKLGDFGLARPRDIAPPANEGPAGTVYYIAPEVIAGRPADIAADLYSFGAMLYEMVTGRVPFSNYDEASILAQHLNESVAAPSESRSHVPPALDALILRLLAKNPKERYASAGEVCQALEEIQATLRNSEGKTNLALSTNATPEYAAHAAQINTLLECGRIVTLVGHDAGVNRVAEIVGRELLAEFGDGVWRVNLADCSDPAEMPKVVAALFGIQEQAGRSLIVSLRQYLQEKNLLLTLSGCSRVMAACARLAELILQTCPEVYILATGPAPLGIGDEQVYNIDGRA